MSAFPSTEVTCMLPVKDMARARRFYEQAVGLAPLGGKLDGKFVYRCGGTEIALFPKPDGTKAHVCVLGSEKAAWFEDPEGNILCLHEDLA